MRVTVRVFARLREIVGAGEIVLEVDAPATIAGVWRALAVAHPGVEPYAKAVSAARNLEYARFETSVGEGDEIAFLPPVSGGGPSTGNRHPGEVRLPAAQSPATPGARFEG